jgi:hypothetical protein
VRPLNCLRLTSVDDRITHKYERLKQIESMSVLEYKSRFIELLMNVPHPILEELRVKQFIRGLRGYLSGFVVGSNCATLLRFRA